ncbi:DoxX family protein [Acidipropionibacterium jensenii]|uniref:DoxX family protein n=1 Tax=Acidipropionibacterium jensenii TaxID=1749 RepID=UPI000BC2CAC5|nr:DoxX family protein [Acidipropionibacterium jensenii]AZZ41193.1 DoxX family protein [Acidipropionibacterium jensenii]
MSKAVKRTTGSSVPDDADNETTRVISSEDVTETQVLGAGQKGPVVPDSAEDSADDSAERTRVISDQPLAADEDLERREAEERRRQDAERRARERAALERAARERALGTVTPPPAEPEPAPVDVPRPVTDRAFASLGLFVFRVVVAGVLGVHGFQHLTQRPETYAMIERIGFPYTTQLVWVLGIGECLAALAILLGLWTRIAGLGAMAIGVLALVFVHWDGLNIFATSGIDGEPALLLAACGFLLFCVGSGGFGIDAGPRRRRALKKANR